MLVNYPYRPRDYIYRSSLSSFPALNPTPSDSIFCLQQILIVHAQYILVTYLPYGSPWLVTVKGRWEILYNCAITMAELVVFFFFFGKFWNFFQLIDLLISRHCLLGCSGWHCGSTSERRKWREGKEKMKNLFHLEILHIHFWRHLEKCVSVQLV